MMQASTLETLPAPEPPADRGVLHRSIQSGKWFLTGVFVTKFLNLITFFILARLLVPGDYGVMAVTMFMVGLVDKLTDPGLGDALVQRKGSVDEYLDTVWTFYLIRYNILGAGLMLFGGAIAGFFHLDPSQAMIVRAGGLLLSIGSFQNIRFVRFARGLQYQKFLVRDVVSQVFLSVTAVSIAFFVSASAWALLAGQLALCIVSTVLSYVLLPVKPKFEFSLKKLRVLFGFGKWVYGQNLLDYVFLYFDKLFIGHMLDPNTLGVYAKAKDLGSVATGTIQSLIGTVGFPALSQVQDRLEKVQEGFRKSLDVLFLVAVPAGLLLALQGGVIVSFILGDRWVGLTLILKLFALGNIILAVNSIFQTVFASLGRPNINLGLHGLQLALTVPFAWLGYRVSGSAGLALAVILTWAVVFVVSWIKSGRVFRRGMASIRPALWSVFGASACTFVLDFFARDAVLGTGSRWIGMGWVCVLGIFYYVVLLGISARLGSGPWDTALSVAASLGLRRKKKSRRPLESPRLSLRLLSTKDATQTYADWLNDPEVNEFLTTKSATRESIRAYIQEQLDKPGVEFYGMFLKNGAQIGTIKLEDINPQEGHATISLMIGDKSRWGAGYGPEAMRRLIRHAFDDLRVSEIRLGVLERNVRAIRSYQKLGFRVTAVEPAWTSMNGRTHDRVLMRCSRDEFIES